MNPLRLFLCCCLFSYTVAAAPSTRRISGFESLDRVRKTWSTAVVGSRVELNANPALVSEGRRSLRLWAKTAGTTRSYYVGAMIAVSPFDCKGKSVVFDVWTTTPQRTKALYVRCYDEKHRIVGSWSNWSFSSGTNGPRTIRLQRGLDLGGMRYEEKLIRSPSTIIRAVEFIMGAREPNVEFDLIVDNLRLSSLTFGTLKNMAQPKKLFLNTPLKLKGRWDALVVPPPGEKSKPMEKLLQTLRAMGEQPIAVVDGSEYHANPRTDRALILLGNVNNNPAVLPFYSHGYCAADSFIPGPGGYVVRTIHDPFGTGKNVIFLGASDPQGIDGAIRLFLSKLPPDLVVPPLAEIKLKGTAAKLYDKLQRKMTVDENSLRRSTQKSLASGGARSIVSRMARMGQNYLLSGNPVWAKWFKCYAFEYDRWAHDKTRKYGAHEGQWGMDVDFVTYRLIPAWDVLEECPVFTDADRLRITRLLAEFVGVDTYRHARSVLGSRRVRHNHQTFPSLGLFFAGTHFKKYYNALEADLWLQTADACFQIQSHYMKPREDSAGYQWLVPTHTARYSLAKPDGAFFWRGHVRRLARLAMMLTDNLGYHPPFGDASGFTGSPSEIPLLRRAVWVYGDVRAQWTLAKKRVLRPYPAVGDYAATISAVEPVDLIGVRTFPLGKGVFDEFRAQAKVSYRETFDKISFRPSYDPQDEYLLVDGISRTGHGHYDGNAVLRLTARGRLWLEDGDYIKSLPKFHNTVMIFKDGQSEKPSDFCRLDEIADLGVAGFSQSTVPDYVKSDWTRTVFWLRHRAFVVFDRVSARESGDYSVRTIWRAMGVPNRDARSLVVKQQDEALRILNAEGTRALVEDDPVRGRNWRGYRLAPPVVRVLTYATNGHLSSGESLGLTNVLRVSSAADAGDLRAKMIARNVLRLEADGVPTICGLRTKQSPREVCDGIRTDASIYAFSPDGFGVTRATRVEVGNWTLRASKPIHAGFDARSSRAIVYCNERVDIRVGSKPLLHLLPGRRLVRLAAENYGCPALRRKPDTAVAFTPSSPMPRATSIPPLGVRWRYEPRPEELLITNNSGRPEAVDMGVTVVADPPPRPRNLFSGQPNLLAALHDGGLLTTHTSVMWPVNAVVALRYDLQRAVDLTKVVIRPWWGATSSKGESFICQRIRIYTSTDGFTRDKQQLWDHVDTGPHTDWGRPLAYTCNRRAKGTRWLSIELTPRTGSSIYLAEIELWADGRTLELPLGSRPTVDCLSLDTWPSAQRASLIAIGASDANVYLLDTNGKQLWRRGTGGPVWTVALSDVDADGAPEVVAGSRDGNVYCYDKDGAVRWTYACQRYHGGPGALVVVFAADLDGDGKKEVIAGSDNWHFHALAHDGKLLWKYETVHRSTCGLAADLDGDGKKEVVCGTEYYYWTVLDAKGKRLWRQRGGPTVNVVTAGDIDGDGKKEVAFGSASGIIYVAEHDGKPKWQFDAGDEITALAIADLDRDGQPEILAASLNFSVYVFDKRGKIIWRRDLGAPVLKLAIQSNADSGTELIAGCSDGRVLILTSEGKERAGAQLDGKILALRPCGPNVLVSAKGAGLAAFGK